MMDETYGTVLTGQRRRVNLYIYPPNGSLRFSLNFPRTNPILPPCDHFQLVRTEISC